MSRSSVPSADTAAPNGTHAAAFSYVGPQLAPKRTDHDTFEIQTVHVQPRVNRHAATRPSLVRVSQMPSEPDQLPKRRAWPYVVVSAAVTVSLLCWHAWQARDTATQVTDSRVSERQAGPRSGAARDDRAASAREPSSAAGSETDALPQAIQVAADETVSVVRPAPETARSRQPQRADRVGSQTPSAKEQSATESGVGASARSVAGQLVRSPWPE